MLRFSLCRIAALTFLFDFVFMEGVRLLHHKTSGVTLQMENIVDQRNRFSCCSSNLLRKMRRTINPVPAFAREYCEITSI